MPTLTRRSTLAALGIVGLSLAWPGPVFAQAVGRLQSWKLATSRKTGIHNLAAAPDGGVWFTAQTSGHLGWFDPQTGRTELLALAFSSSLHGVIQGPGALSLIGRTP